jgi:hypothetical protein
MKFWADGQQPFPYRVMEELLVTQEQFREARLIGCEGSPNVYATSSPLNLCSRNWKVGRCYLDACFYCR